MMSQTEAQTYRRNHDNAVKVASQMTKAQLKARYVSILAERGQQLLSGGPASKDELVSAVVGLDFPIARLNEAIHVLYHGEWKNDACDYCRAEFSMIEPDAQPPF